MIDFILELADFIDYDEEKSIGALNNFDDSEFMIIKEKIETFVIIQRIGCREGGSRPNRAERRNDKLGLKNQEQSDFARVKKW